MKRNGIVIACLLALVCCGAGTEDFDSITLGDGLDTNQTLITFLKGYSESPKLEYATEMWGSLLDWNAFVFRGGKVAGTGVASFLLADSYNIAAIGAFNREGTSPGCVVFGHSGGGWTAADAVNADYTQMCHFGNDEVVIFYYCHAQNNCVRWMTVAGNIDGNTIVPSVVMNEDVLFGATTTFQTNSIAAFEGHYSVEAGSASPGASGPSSGENNATAYTLLDRVGPAEELFFSFDMPPVNCWDGGTIWVVLYTILTAAENAGDDIDATLECEHYTEHEDQNSATSELRSVDHDLGNFNAQWMTHNLTYRITPASIDPGDVVSCKFYLDDITTGTPVGELGFIHADVHWPSICPTENRFEGVPAEG